MTCTQQLQLVESVLSPGKQYSKLVSNITNSKTGIIPYYSDKFNTIINNDCLEVLARLPDDSIDMIFADPPYLLSNDGFTCQNGRMVNVNKGKWDKSKNSSETRFSVDKMTDIFVQEIY
jgi:site-specific DNA-methyltransferase (adenine-specific)